MNHTSQLSISRVIREPSCAARPPSSSDPCPPSTSTSGAFSQLGVPNHPVEFHPLKLHPFWGGSMAKHIQWYFFMGPRKMAVGLTRLVPLVPNHHSPPLVAWWTATDQARQITNSHAKLGAAGLLRILGSQTRSWSFASPRPTDPWPCLAWRCAPSRLPRDVVTVSWTRWLMVD